LQSELLSRRLAHNCCKRIGFLFNEVYASYNSNPNGDGKLARTKKLVNNTALTTMLNANNKESTPQKTPSNTATFGQVTTPDAHAKSKTLMSNPSFSNINSSTTTNSANNNTKQEPPATTSPPTQTTPTSAKQQLSPKVKTVPLTTVNERVSVSPCLFTFESHIHLNLKTADVFTKYLECPSHKDALVLLTSILHSIVLGCSQALLWNNIGDGKTDSAYNSSPLDHLPCAPSNLIFTYSSLDKSYEHIKAELEKAELSIKMRSISIENKWTTEQLQQVSSKYS
jgi:hypothetical protein